MASAPAPHGVARILYKEIVPGDLRKILAESNDSKTGGGARDFRFGDYKNLVPVVNQMFPQVSREKRRRKGMITEVEIRKGTFCWDTGGGVQKKAVEFEPPTSARPSEGRITCVHEQPALDVALIPKVNDDDKVILLLVQRNDGSVWPYFTHLKSLATEGAWDNRVASEIIRCVGAARAEGRATIGFRDFTTGDGYCNGK